MDPPPHSSSSNFVFSYNGKKRDGTGRSRSPPPPPPSPLLQVLSRPSSSANCTLSVWKRLPAGPVIITWGQVKPARLAIASGWCNWADQQPSQFQTPNVEETIHHRQELSHMWQRAQIPKSGLCCCCSFFTRFSVVLAVHQRPHIYLHFLSLFLLRQIHRFGCGRRCWGGHGHGHGPGYDDLIRGSTSTTA